MIAARAHSIAARGLAVALALVAGCDDGKTHQPPDGDVQHDAPAPRWWQPEPGSVKDWDVQLAAPFDVSADRTMYDLDLWAVATATTLDYGDGDPVAVPAGALAGTIATLHARNPPPVVICHVDTGAVRLTDPDARKFPGFDAAPPDRPDAPAPGSVIGWSTPAGADERYLDVRAASRATVAPLVWKRLELAEQLGCDGVEADRNDMILLDPGFALTPDEQESWYREVAAQAHQRELSVGLKNGTTVPGQIDSLAADFDWAMVERCGEFVDCDAERPVINLHRAVLAIDYATDIDGGAQDAAFLCARQQAAMIADGLIKDVALTGAVRTQCVP